MPRSLWQCTLQMALSLLGTLLAQTPNEVAVELGNAVAHGIGNVDRARAFLDDGFADARQKIDVGSVAILGRELDVATQVAGEPHGLRGLLQNLLARHPQLLLHVEFAGGNEGMDAGPVCTGQGLRRTRNVAVVGPGQRADGAVAHGRSDGLDGLEIAIARSGEAGLNDIDPHALQLASDTQFFLSRHGRAGRLLAIAQGGVENDELIGHRTFSSRCWGTATGARDRPDKMACMDARTMLPSMPTPWRVWSPTRISR